MIHILASREEARKTRTQTQNLKNLVEAMWTIFSTSISHLDGLHVRLDPGGNGRIGQFHSPAALDWRGRYIV